ncbi:type III-B CRISPR module RAMP protein Cmr6 [Hyalangium sp.]|uniref:type III-B CRISPR module RAMP protein Cmr6 n=1 Tax=Hyalangium sp. TaxID=2028555 RepID=UPI002D439158|nr:type III-B CRISPR module RAMP protein Cmr6 [Hyalangium sp.]HYH97866.1 type III-B CRISPR module RAMP protein Cmr6 [Hyalangium sp.]
MWLGQDGERPGGLRPEKTPPSHAGLGSARWAPLRALLAKNEQDAAVRSDWLDRLAQCREPVRYAHAYDRWRAALQGPDTLCFTVRALGRVLVGHGNTTAAGVGLTLHHTWGVPVLPGSALKGLTAGYVEAVYGPGPGEQNPEREPFRGLTWEGSRMARGPGDVFRRLFGAPDVDEPGRQASAGKILFHDALWVPAEAGTAPMLARDVLTVHQRRYYESSGGEWPGDFDDPNPVSFLTVAPGGRFLVALELAPDVEGGRALLERAGRYLTEALKDWGLGGKTAAGYGRFSREEASPRPARELQTPALAELKAWLEEQKAAEVPQREQFRLLEREWWERLLGLVGEERRAAGQLLKKYLKLKRREEQQRLEALLAQLHGGTPPLSGS